MSVPPRVSQHAAYSSFTSLSQLVTQLPANFEAQQPNEMARTKATVSLLTERFNDSAAVAISDGALNNLQSWLQVMVSELQSAISQNNPNAIASGTNYYNHLEALGQNLGQLPVSTPSEALTAASEEAQQRLAAMQRVQIEHEAEARAARDQQQRLIREAQDAKDEGLRRLEEQELAAGKLLAALGARATSSGYAGTAGEEKAQADFWRKVTFGGGILTALLAVALFLQIHTAGVASIATRVGVTVPAILLTVYAGRQSAGHRAQEREARRLELAFGSVDAYLADLGATNRAELKTLLSSNLFTSGSGHAHIKPGEDYPTSADLVKLLDSAIKRIR